MELPNATEWGSRKEGWGDRKPRSGLEGGVRRKRRQEVGAVWEEGAGQTGWTGPGLAQLWLRRGVPGP